MSSNKTSTSESAVCGLSLFPFFTIPCLVKLSQLFKPDRVLGGQLGLPRDFERHLIFCSFVFFSSFCHVNYVFFPRFLFISCTVRFCSSSENKSFHTVKFKLGPDTNIIGAGTTELLCLKNFTM